MSNDRVERIARRKQRKKALRFFFFIFCFFTLGVVIMYEFSYVAMHSTAPKKQTRILVPVSSKNAGVLGQADSGLSDVVKNSISQSPATYGIVIKNFKTGEIFTYDDSRIFESGSLYKLWIMAVTYQQIQQGKLDEDQVLSEDVRVLNDKFDISSDEADLTDGTITLSVRSALNQMITISHNYAALLLTEKLKLSTIKKFLSDKGFTQSTVGTNGELPTTTAHDVGLFFEKLYGGQLANSDYTQEMIGLLKNQQLNNKIPKYLPDDVVIAHKTGELDEYSHDAGVIYTPNGNYILAVLTKSDDPTSTEDTIGKLSQAVYEYVTKGGDTK